MLERSMTGFEIENLRSTSQQALSVGTDVQYFSIVNTL